MRVNLPSAVPMDRLHFRCRVRQLPGRRPLEM